MGIFLKKGQLSASYFLVSSNHSVFLWLPTMILESEKEKQSHNGMYD